MMILLSPAKTMTGTSTIKAPDGTTPRYSKEANEIALQMTQFTTADLSRILKINPKLAIDTYRRYQDFHATEVPALQALLAYTGIVFQHIHPSDFTEKDFFYAQDHLRFSSPCYGLLRPLDLIKPYRMEFDLSLPELGEGNMFSFWRSRHTKPFIKEIKSGDGLLINLASNETQSSFDWKQIEKETRVITPDFKVNKDGKLKTIVVYAKMMRGEMTRFILKNRITDPEQIKAFTWEGFIYNDQLSEGDHWVFTQV